MPARIPWLWIAALAVAAVAQRCSVQTRLAIKDGENVERWNSETGTGDSIPEGIPPQPLMLGQGPYFTQQLKNGLLCYTGGATGNVVPKETCRCSREYAAYAQKIVDIQRDGALSDADVDLEATAALSAAAEECSQMETMTRPPSVWPTAAAFVKATREAELAGTTINASSLGPFDVHGRICQDPSISVTNTARDNDMIAPWEFQNLKTGAAACGCARDVEYISQNFAPEDPEAAAYTEFAAEVLKQVPVVSRATDGDSDAGTRPLGTCNVLRAGYGWQGSKTPGLPLSGAGVSPVSVNASETEIPLFPRSPETIECGGILNMDERINFCLFQFEETVDVLEVPPENVRELAAFCADRANSLSGDGRFTKCCMEARVWKNGDPDDAPSTATMIRRDMLITLACRAAPYAINSGTGRFHTVPRGPFDDAALRSASLGPGAVEGTFMPDLTEQTRALVRDRYLDAGYSHVCIPNLPETSPTCTAFSPFNMSSSPYTRETIGDGTREDCVKKLSEDQTSPGATENMWSSTRAGQFASLRRAAMPWNSCVLPPVYATSGRPVREKVGPAAVLRHTMALPQRFKDQTYGWTDADFNDCTLGDVPALVQAWYTVVQNPSAKTGATASCGSMLRWWASMPPEFYVAAASAPAAIADYFTLDSEKCLPNIPGRGSKSTDGVQGPNVGPDHTPPDQTATCSTQSCCPVPLPANFTGSRREVCQSFCLTGNDPLEVVTTKFGVDEITKLLSDCFDSNKMKYPVGDMDPNNPTHWCKMAGQYTRDNTMWKIRDDFEAVPLFPKDDGIRNSIGCATSAETGRVAIKDGIITFVSTAPRMGAAPVHPIFQWSGYVVDDGEARNTESVNFNFTAPGSKWTDSPAYAEPPSRPTRYPSGDAGPNVPVNTRVPENPASATMTYDGVELAIVADSSCLVNNHRETVQFSNGDTQIRMPGLFPRWIDFQAGGLPSGPDLGSCLVFDDGNSGNLLASDGTLAISNWQTAGDRFSVDLYSRGGGQAPVPDGFGSFIKSHTSGYPNRDEIVGTSTNNRPQFPTLGVCLTKDPNRCNAKCDLTSEVDSIAEGVGLIAASIVATAIIPGAIAPASTALVSAAEGGSEVAAVAEDAGILAGDGAEAAGEDAAETEEQAAANEATEAAVRPKPVEVKVHGEQPGKFRRFLAGTSRLGGKIAGIKGGKSLFDAAGTVSSSGALAIERDVVHGLFHARLNIKREDPVDGQERRYIFLDTFTNRGSDALENLYRYFPSMVRACVNGEDDCIRKPDVTDGSNGDPLQDGTWASLFGPSSRWKVNGGNRRSANDYVEDVAGSTPNQNDCHRLHIGVSDDKGGPQTPWWAGHTSVLETTTLGIQLGCRTAEEGGEFKQAGPASEARSFGLRSFRYESDADGSSIEFQTTEADLVSRFFAGKDGDKRIYTAVDSDGEPFDIRSTVGPAGLCDLCAAIGPASDTSMTRESCRLPGGSRLLMRYDIEDSLGIFDRPASNFFGETGLYTDETHSISKVCFEYFDVLANSTECVEAETATGNSNIERLLGAKLGRNVPLAERAVDRPACIGNLHSGTAATCDIDAGLFHVAEDAAVCTSPTVTFNTTCPSPRWSNDRRITFPEPVPQDAFPPPTFSDFDPRAEDVSYCANVWNFSDPRWYESPEAPRVDRNILSRHDPASKSYVYCAGDSRTPETRHRFCLGDETTGTGEAYITVFGVRLGIRTTRGDLCHLRLDGSYICLFFPGETGGAFPTVQSVIDAFDDIPTVPIEIVAVPASFDIVASAVLMFMTDVSTIYYNSPSDVGAENYVESAGPDGGILGRRVNISWAESIGLFSGLCHAEVSDPFFAQLYAAIEQFRVKDLFVFPNFDGSLGENRRRRVANESTVYPAQTETRIDFGEHPVVFRGAFTTSVAEAASKLLGRQVEARPFRLGGLPGQTQTGCTRVLVQEDATRLESLQFEQGGACRTAVAESARVPVIIGGQKARNAVIRDTVCVDCPGGVVQARGGDAALGTHLDAANVDVEGVFLAGTTFLWSPNVCSGGDSISACQGASLPGVETAWARIVGDPVISRCSAEAAGADIVVDQFCDILAAQKQPHVADAQEEGKPISTALRPGVIGNQTCSNACPTDFEPLFGPLDPPCCDGTFAPSVFSCGADGTYVRTPVEDGAECSAVNCLWHATGNASLVGSWVDTEPVDETTTENGAPDTPLPDVSPEICRVFYRLCPPGACPVDELSCERCGANKTLFSRCADTFQAGTVPRPCAETNDLEFSDGTVVSGTREEVMSAAARITTVARCSVLGCPPAALHTTHSDVASLGTCVPGSTSASTLENLRQTWLVRSGVDGSGPVPSADGGRIISPGIPRLQIPAPVVLSVGGVNSFSVLDTYSSDPTRGFYTAQLAVEGEAGPDGTCLSRPEGLTETGSEPGGPLEIRECSGTDSSQAWLFVYHPEIDAWRIQIPGDPYQCITDLSDAASAVFPPPGTLTTPVVTACTGCAVGVAESGTGGPSLVSTVLDFPSILFDSDTPVGVDMTDHAFFPLSATIPELRLLVSLRSGKCIRLEPPPPLGFLGVGTSVPGGPAEVPCSLLEGAPVAQIAAAAGNASVCDDAIGLLVAACVRRTGGISMIDGSRAVLGALCTRLGGGSGEVTSAGGGRGGRIRCAGTTAEPFVRVLAGGSGFRDGDEVAVDGATTSATVVIAKLLWQPHESAEAAASEPISGPATEVLNVSSLFNLYGGDAALWNVFAAGIGSATASYVAAGFEIAAIAGALLVHAYFLAGLRTKDEK